MTLHVNVPAVASDYSDADQSNASWRMVCPKFACLLKEAKLPSPKPEEDCSRCGYPRTRTACARCLYVEEDQAGGSD